MQHPEEAEEEAWIYNGQPEVPPTVKIAENVTAIPDEAFHEHPELEEVVLSSSVQFILYRGPENEEVGIPSNVRDVDECAFFGCKLLARLVLKEGLERIGVAAFHSCESLTEVRIPSTVRVIDDDAFQSCSSLAKLIINEGLERIGKVDIPSTVEGIDGWAFEYCIRLARPVLNEGVERIGRNAFCCCDSLTEVEIPSTVKVIDIGGFKHCTLLARLVLNEGLERIGEKAFLECESLSHVIIPQSVNSLATNAFSICSHLISTGSCQFNLDLSGCQSLAGPISILFPDEEDPNGRGLGQLSIIVPDEEDREEFFKAQSLAVWWTTKPISRTD
eukprot:scaffold4571_cov72-Cylindrotheca_fusiformis.AAC.2